MRIKKYIDNGGDIFAANIINYVSGFYGDLPAWLNNQMLNMVIMTIYDDFSTRELIYDNTSVDSDLINEITGRNTRLIVRNKQKYDHLFKLFNLDYNPIWNVDGTETTAREIVNSNESTGNSTSTLTHNTNVNTDTEDKTTYNTEDKTTYNSTLTTNDDSTVTNNLNEETTDNKARTTFDSSTFYDTDKTIINKEDTGTVETNNDIDETKTGDDTINKTGTETHEITGDVKTTGTETTVIADGSTNSGTVSENVTHIRQGNIGVTQTQTMAMSEVEYSNYIKFIDIVALDVVRNFSLGV